MLVLAQPDEASKAIRLGAMALVVSLVGLYVLPLKVVAFSMLLLTAHRLHYRCELSHMSELSRKVRWFWMTTVISLALLLFSVASELIRGEYRPLMSTSGSSIRMSTRQTDGRRVTAIDYSDMAGSIEVTTDAQGRRVVALLNDFGTVISTSTLRTGERDVLSDAAGKSVRVTLDAAGKLTIKPRAPSELHVYPNGRTGVVMTQGGPLGMLLGFVLAVTGLAATIFFVLVCRTLALRSNDPRLARRFTTILRLIVLSVAALAVVAVSNRLGLGSKFGKLILIAPAGAGMLSLLVAAVGLIVASFRLSLVLRRAPRHWSEVATVPDRT